MAIENQEGRSWDRFYRAVFAVAVAALLFSLGLGYYGYRQQGSQGVLSEPFQAHPIAGPRISPMHSWPAYQKIEAVVLMGWVLLPPLFFWLEYFGIYRRTRHYRYGEKCPDDWEMFKYSQDVSAKVWIAVSTVLFILYFGKDMK